MPKRQAFKLPKSRSLKRRLLVKALYNRSANDVHTVSFGCIRILARFVPLDQTGSDEPVLVGFAPGRKTRRAVDRNAVKRRMREAFRHEQYRLVGMEHLGCLTLMLLFRGTMAQIRDVASDSRAALIRLEKHLGSATRQNNPTS